LLFAPGGTRVLNALSAISSNPREDSAKLNWDGVRCLFQDAQSDILLLLDSCAVKDAPPAGSQGVKQVVAACPPGHNPREPGSRSFTSYLVDALHKLSAGAPFSVQKLYHSMVAHQQDDVAQSRLPNGANKGPPTPANENVPLFFTLTGKGRDLMLAPLASKSKRSAAAAAAEAGQQQQPDHLSLDDHVIRPEALAGLTFDEARILACTTFVGEASPDMAFFNQWVKSSPSLASKVTVEGMFIGPPTMLLISMPSAVWNAVQHDKVCVFLGYISTHNMTHLYNRLMGSPVVGAASAAAATAKDVEDGRILLEAREAASGGPPIPAALHARHDANSRAAPLPGLARQAFPPGIPPPVGGAPPPHPPRSAAGGGGKEDGEDSAEVKEAAEQLKALSHIRHASDGSPSSLNHRTPQRPADCTPPNGKLEDAASSHGANDSAQDEIQYQGELFTTPTSSSKIKPRKSLPKQTTPKQETRCDHCSHAPFKDSSSLRKHIAAAHTRPFPCAFSFAGCTSTFGSKNEWKRHIASQHLCLTYYRCSSCNPSTAEGKGNEFNRKDLFTQHLRRMHAPFPIKKNTSKADSQVQADWEARVKEMQSSCLVIRRKPPQKSACPKADCPSSFEGANAWDEWTEHVGRHMEKGLGAGLGVDPLLAKWAVDEGIIERHDDGEYRLVAQQQMNGASGAADKDAIMAANASFASDPGLPNSKHEDGTPPAASAAADAVDHSTITVATAVVAAAAQMEADRDKMDVD